MQLRPFFCNDFHPLFWRWHHAVVCLQSQPGWGRVALLGQGYSDLQGCRGLKGMGEYVL